MASDKPLADVMAPVPWEPLTLARPDQNYYHCSGSSSEVPFGAVNGVDCQQHMASAHHSSDQEPSNCMVAALFDIAPLRPALEAGELILTANDRLRRHILRAWDQDCSNRNLRAWKGPPVWALNRWLEDQWQRLVEKGYPGCQGVIAARHQRQLLWEQVIVQSPGGSELLQAEPLARDADAALRTLELWEVHPETLSQPDLYHDPNSEQFALWLKDFRLRMDQCGLLTPETSQRILIDAFQNGALPRMTTLWLEGFDDLPPLHRRLLEAAADDQVRLPPTGLSGNQLIRTEAGDAEAEIRAAALWSLKQLEQAPEAVVGIIVPDLGQRRAQVERLFSEVFEPTAALPNQPRYTLPFNFSAGQPLGSTALIHSALTLLQLGRDSAELEPLCALLHSPFWSDPDNELVLRTRLTDQLRRLGKFTLTGSNWRHYSQRLTETLELPAAGGLAERLQQLDSHRRRLPTCARAGDWAEAFRQQLDLLGWPGTRRLDSQEYQQLGLWYELLETFATLSLTDEPLNLAQALKQLTQLAQQTPFQAQTPDSPVQILGVLEGAGLRFSHCWVMGLHHRQWPPVPAPNPLLPLDLQRRKQMPHASAERELRYARSLTENYRHCAPLVVFSSPVGEEQGELRPSPLIRALPLTPLEQLVPDALSDAQRHHRQLAEARALEPVDCARGPALDLSMPAPGGSGLFKHQASCPFNAFAQLRLGARQPDPPVAGLSAAERGTVLHEALATFWRQIKDWDALHCCSDGQLEDLLAECCDLALDPFRIRRPRELGPTYLTLERERLQQMLGRWLALEKARPPFQVVAVEQGRQLQFQGLKLSLRIDRVDRLANGELLLIDYKTGEPGPQGWLGERPSEPQLPLYAVTQPKDVAGVAFAQLNAKALKWIGMGALEVPFDGVKPPPDEWPQQLAEWRQVLETLAADFSAGDARVDFKDAEAQRYSEALLPLNRAPESDALKHFLTTESALGSTGPGSTGKYGEHSHEL